MTWRRLLGSMFPTSFLRAPKSFFTGFEVRALFRGLASAEAMKCAQDRVSRGGGIGVRWGASVGHRLPMPWLRAIRL
jgi:hypothetical protein